MTNTKPTPQEQQYEEQLRAVRENSRKNSSEAPSQEKTKGQLTADNRFNQYKREAPKGQPDSHDSYYADGSSRESENINTQGYAKKITTPTNAENPYQARQPKQLNEEEKQQQQKGEPGKGAERLATGGQIAGRTTQVVAKGTEMVAKGTEMVSRGVKQGGQKLTQAGAELSGTGLGAIAGVPMMIAGGAMTVGGAAGEAASKGTQKAAQGAGRFGQKVAESSKKAKQGIKEAKSLDLGANLGKGKDSTGMPYMDLARKLREEKRKVLHGDVTGVLNDAANTAGKLLSARILSWAWLTLIPTFGLSLIYINIHFIARYIAHSEKFCDFGEEWALKKVTGAAGEAAKPLEEASAMLEKVEILGMVALDILIVGLIVIIKIVMDLGACLATHPVDTVLDPSSCYANPTQ